MKTYAEKVIYYMMEEWGINSRLMHKGIDKGLFSLIRKDEMSLESVQESAKNSADFVKSIDDGKEYSINIFKMISIFFSFIWQGGPHMPFKN